MTVVFNRLDDLRDTIVSVTSQHCRNFEYLIIDGASTDGSTELATELTSVLDQDSVRVVSEPDRGIYDAMNKSITLARGRYVLFLNTGDLLFDSNTICNLTRAIAGYDPVSRPVILFGSSVTRGGRDANESLDISRLWRGPVFRHNAALIETQYHRQNLYSLKKSLAISADFDFLYRTYAAGETIHRIDQVLIRYQVDGVSNRPIKNLWWNWRIVHTYTPSLKVHLYYVAAMIARVVGIASIRRRLRGAIGR